MNKQMAITMFLALFLMVGCASEGAGMAGSTKDVDGLFERSRGHGFMSFDGNGTFRLGPSRMLVTIEPPIAPPSEYWFEGEQLHIEPASGDPLCDGISAVYDVHFSESGNLSFVAVDDGCEPRLISMQGSIDSQASEPEVEWETVE